MALSVQESWAALVKAATAYRENNKPVSSPWGSFPTKKANQSPSAPAAGDYKGLGLGQDTNRLLAGLTKTSQRSYGTIPDEWKNTPQGQALLAEAQNASLENAVAVAQKAYMDAQAQPQPSESRGQLRVDLDTSPVQTKDSVMYRNAGDGEEGTIGEASRPNKRKPGLSSNLGINL